MLISSAGLALMSSLAVMPIDCGATKYAESIAKTNMLVIQSSTVNVPVGEMPTKAGHRECVRFSFLIDKNGVASDIKIEESSGSYMLNVYARRALEKYCFLKVGSTDASRRDIVFEEDIDKWPTPPPMQSRVRGGGGD